MNKLIRRWFALSVVFLLILTVALAAPNLPDSMAPLGEYLRYLDTALMAEGESPVNSLIDRFSNGAVLAITSYDDAEIPEDVELDFKLEKGKPYLLTLRVSTVSRFASIAGACLWAAAPETSSLNDCVHAADVYAQKAFRDPTKSFEDKVFDMPGPSPRAYYAYYPDQYHDGVNWLQLTLVFPAEGSAESAVAVTPQPTVRKYADDYEGYLPVDDGVHLEVFTTATPEPNSPADWYGI